MGFAIALALVGLGQAADAALVGSPILVKDVCWWPDVCYNAYSDQYLVFWRDYNAIPQVHARRVDANTGALLGSDFAVSNWSDAYRTGVGDAVYNSSNHEWFVVYTQCLLNQQEDIYGQRIDSAGNQVGSAISVCTDGEYQNQSTVTYDSTSNKYLVTWTHWTDERKVRGRILDQYGSPVGSQIQISDSSIYRKSVSSCVYNPVSNEYLVVWGDDRNWNGQGNNNDWGDIYAQRINASTGALVGGNFMVCGPEGTPYVPDGMDSATVVCNTGNGRYFLAVSRLLPVGGWVARGRVLNPDGTAYTGLFDASYPDGGVSVGAVYNPVENSFVMSCLDAVPEVHDINVRRFTATGAALGSPFKIFNSNYECNFGGLAIRPSDGKMMQVTQWFEDKISGIRINTVMAQRFDVSGIPVAPVANFVVRSPNQQSNLSWTNPADSAFTGTMIRYRTDTYPTSPTDGALVVDKSGSPGANETYAHSGLTNGVAYYYAAWAHDGGPSYSVPKYAWGIPTPSLCFLDTFPYPDGALNGNGGWSGTATNQIEVSGQTVKINGDTANYSSTTTTSCSGGASGVIWMRVNIRQGAGADKYIWSLRINDTSGANLARWYGSGSTARPRIGDGTSVLAPQNLTGPGVWDVLEVKINTATDSSEFFFNGTSIGELSHSGAGNTAGELKFETMGNDNTSGHYVYLDDLTVGEYDATLPDPVTSFTATGGDTQVSLSWTNPTDPDYAGTKILCKTTGYPTSATDGIVVYDGPGTSQVHTGLANDLRYYYSAFTHNAILNYSSAVNAWADTVANATILEAKGLANNQIRALRGNIVSATGSGYFYIQDPSELQGMKIVAPDAVSQGQKLDVVGTILGEEGAERYLDCSGNAVKLIAPGPISLNAIGTGARSVGGGAFNSYTPGVMGGVGVNNIGLLMRVWGKVTQRNTSAPQYFYINDGAGLKDGTQTAGVDNVGIRILANPTDYPTGSYVIVTGAASTFNSGGLRPRILPQAGAIRTVAP